MSAELASNLQLASGQRPNVIGLIGALVQSAAPFVFESDTAKARTIRATVRFARERDNAHSQILTTVQPDARRVRVTARSPCAFRTSFGPQYSTRDVGTRP